MLGDASEKNRCLVPVTQGNISEILQPLDMVQCQLSHIQSICRNRHMIAVDSISDFSMC